MNHRKYLTAVILGLTASLLTSCNNGSNTGDTPAVVPEPILVTPPPVAEPEPTKEEQLAKLEAELATVDTEIKAMIGQAQCASSLDCRLLLNDSEINMIHSCNGLYFHAAYSIVETNQEILAAAHIKRGKIRDKIFRIKNGLSDGYVPGHMACTAIVRPWPVVNCNNNRCQGRYEYPEGWFNDMPVPANGSALKLIPAPTIKDARDLGHCQSACCKSIR